MEERYERIKSFITENGCVLVTPFNVFDKNKMIKLNDHGYIGNEGRKMMTLYPTHQNVDN